MGLRLKASPKRVAAWVAVAGALVLVYVRIRYAGYFADLNRFGPDYPKTNPRPTHLIDLRVTIPTTLKVQLFADYWTYDGKCLQTHYETIPPHQEDLRLAEAIDLRGAAAEQKEASVAVDKYLPGRCDWYFSDIRYFLPEGVKTPDSGQQLLEDIVAPSLRQVARSMGVGWQPKAGELREKRVDLWCTRYIGSAGPSQGVACSTWDQAVGRRQPALTHPPDVPESQRTPDSWITYILPSTKVVEIHFHDLDAK